MGVPSWNKLDGSPLTVLTLGIERCVRGLLDIFKFLLEIASHF